MPARSPLAPFLEPLERLGLPYCVTGSVAASVYGEPRLTADIGVVLLLKIGDVALLRTASSSGVSDQWLHTVSVLWEAARTKSLSVVSSISL